MLKGKNYEYLKVIWSRPFYASMIFFIATFIFFVGISFVSEGDPNPDDHYFHFKYAYLLRTQGWDVVQNFDWIYLTGLANSDSRYTVNLFQISLIPFTFIDDQLFALHVADAFYASVVFAILYYLLRKTNVKHALLWTFLLFGFMYFPLRMLFGRAFVLITGVMFLEMYFAVEKKYKAVFFVSLLHVLWHHSTFFMPFVAVGVVEMSRYLVYQRFFYKNVIAVLCGVIFGMIFYPGFPGSLFGWSKALFAIQSDATMNEGMISLGGSELYAKDFMGQMVDAEIIIALFIFCVIAVIFIYAVFKRQYTTFSFDDSDHKTLLWSISLFIWMIIMMLGSISISGRVFDFLIPAIFFLSGIVTTFLLKKEIINMRQPFNIYMRTGVMIFVVIFFLQSCIAIYESKNSFDFQPTQKAALWIRDHSQEKEGVFLYNWSSFSMLFFANAHNVYSMGIEPMALMGYDESLYWKYYNIFRNGYYCEKKYDCRREVLAEKELAGNKGQDAVAFVEKKNAEKIVLSIKNDFKAQFIFSDSRDFTRTIELNPQLIDQKFYIKSDRVNGKLSEITVFKLK